MSLMRLSALGLLLGLLAGCDEAPRPSSELATAAPGVAQAAEPQIRQPEPVVPRVPPAVTAQQLAPPAKQHAAVPAKKTPAAPPPVPVSEPLDLSLPPELVKHLEFGQAVDESGESRLPPLFVEKPAEPSAFQLNGKLLTKPLDDSEDYLKSVEGAELQIEFKH